MSGPLCWELKSLLYTEYFFSEWTSDQLNVSWLFFSSLLGGCNSKATAHPPKSDNKNGQRLIRKRNTPYKIETLIPNRGDRTWHGANPSRETVLSEGFSLTKFESRPFKRNSSTPCPFPQMSQNYVHLLESVKDLNFRFFQRI